jgi:ATP-binding cassette subfamily B protein
MSGDRGAAALRRPWWRRLDLVPRREFPFVRQQDSADCGAACLAMIGRHYGRRLSVHALRDLSHTGHQGTSLLALSAVAEAIGFRTLRARTGLDQLGECA